MPLANPSASLAAIADQFKLTRVECQDIRKAMLEDMKIGVRTGGKESWCKMLPSRVRLLPNGTEQGVFYAIDWGGSNVRFIRVQLKRNASPQIDYVKRKIPKELRTCTDVTELFDFLAEQFKQHMIKHNEFDSERTFPVGFTFSFPVKVPQLNQGILVQWSKGFNIQGVIGQDIAGLMNSAFSRYKIPAVVEAICNDTVGTLISCSYDHPNTKIGIIIGTGTNAAYYEEQLDEVINIEWGNFDVAQKYLRRVPGIDDVMDKYTPNAGVFVAEKMVSGMYCGEIIRLLINRVFAQKMPASNSILLDKFGEFGGLSVTILLRMYYNNNSYYGTRKILEVLHSEEYNLKAFDEQDVQVLVALFQLVLDRSADVSACLMLGVLQKIGVFTETSTGFELCDKYKRERATVGIDGGVFLNMPQYPQRIRKRMVMMVGEKIVNRVNIVHAEDGSGRGAGLCVAALHRNESIKSKL